MRKLIINKFVILSEQEKSAAEYLFDSKMNVIIGGNKSGKSSLAKSILYTLGCDVVFENEWQYLGKTYLLFFEFDNESYSIKRVNLTGKYHSQKGSNVFELVNLNTNEINRYDKTTDLATFLNKLFGLEIQLLTRKTLEITQIFPNHMFLLNYLDQDTSWGNLLTDTFKHQSFLVDYKNSLVDFFLGYRTNEFYKISNQIKNLQKDKAEYSNEKASLEKLYDINLRKIKVVENVDTSTFKETLLRINDKIQVIIEKESKLKTRLSDYIYEKSKLGVINKDFKRTLDRSDIDASGLCPVCGLHKKIMNEDLYIITNNMYEVRKERDLNLVILSDLENKIEKTKLDVNVLVKEQVQLTRSLKIGEDKLDLMESIKNFGIIELSKEIEAQIKSLTISIDGKVKEVKVLQKKIKDIYQNEELVNKYYANLKRVFSKLNIDFKPKNDTNNFLRFSTAYSGTERVSSIIGFYLNINKFISLNQDAPTFPFILDTLYKEDYDNKNELNLINVYFSEMNQVDQQQILFTSDRSEVIKYLKNNEIEYKTIHGKRSLLSKEKYLSIKNKYAQFNL